MSPQFERKNIKRIELTDFPNPILSLIFQRCYPVTLHRCRLVCKKWRKIIDELDEGYLEPFRSAGHLRLYVCDRRRAILEKFLEHQPLSCSVRDLTSFRKTAYVKDCLAQVNEDISWDYQFDLTSWSQKYEIIEVCLQNFGSFLERDPKAAQSSLSELSPGGEATKLGLTQPLATVPFINAAVKNEKKLASSAHTPSMEKAYNPSEEPYNLLPSTRRLKAASISPVIYEYDESMSEIFTRLSSGRFERLADKLRAIQPLHIVFNDLSSYERRPTMLLFWFLKQLTNVRKLTFNCVRGDQKVEIDRILSVIGLDEINIIQPQEDACLIVNGSLLDAFLDVPCQKRRRFRLRFTGRTEINASSIIDFLNKWQNHKDVIAFHTILIDAMNVLPEEFVLTCLYGEKANTIKDERRRNQMKQDYDLLRKVLVFEHRKSRCSIKYRYEDGYLLFTFFNPNEIPPCRISHSDKPKVLAFHSPKSNHENYVEQKCTVRNPNRSYQGENFLSRIFSGLLRSSA